MGKTFRLRADQIRRLIPGRGGCIAADSITCGGRRVGWMYREQPHTDVDSGWRFFAGDEPQAYVDDSSHFEIYDINTIANYDPDIIPLLDAPIGSAFGRDEGMGRLVSEAFLPPGE